MVEATTNQEQVPIEESKSTDVVETKPVEPYRGPDFKENIIKVNIRDAMKQG